MPYDYSSVLHYRSAAFSKLYGTQTIVPRIPSAARLMGQRIRFSKVDIAKLNRLYKCPVAYYLGDDLQEQDLIRREPYLPAHMPGSEQVDKGSE